MKNNFIYYATAVQTAMEDYFNKYNDIPEPLKSAMKYSLFAGGKRLRPALLLNSCTMCGGSEDRAMPFACAMEMIHTYSLIHDDLPGMDNDDLRRGRPTCHKVYGEGIAILAGDGLLSMACEIMVDTVNGDMSCAGAMCRIIRAAGVRGMVAGQCADMQAERDKTIEIDYIHRHKTGDMITASVVAGGMLAGADKVKIALLETYGQHLGMAFQITDDILDIAGNAAVMGKNTNADKNKLTYPNIYGLEQSRSMAKLHVEKAVAALHYWGQDADFLCSVAQTLIQREK